MVLRLCIISNPNSIHTLRWLRYFIDRNYDVHFIADRPIRQPLPDNVKVVDLANRFNLRKIRYPIWSLYVRRYLRDTLPDVLHAHQVASAGWLGASSGYHPFMLTAWGSDLLVGPQRSASHRLLARWVLRKADYVTCVSSSLAQAARALGADPDRLEVAPWGVDTDIFHPTSSKKAVRERLGLGSGPIVLSLRAINQIYNPLDIARTIPLVLERIPSVRFIIFTYNHDPSLLEEFKSIIKINQASYAVQYIDNLSDDNDIADINRAADVALSIPSSDGTPKSVLESLACGTPLVLSDIPPLHEWVQHEQEGLYVPIGDIKAIRDSIVRLLSDKILCNTLSKNGLQLIQKRADSKIWMRHAEEIYYQVSNQQNS